MDLINYLFNYDSYSAYRLTKENSPELFNALLKTSQLPRDKIQKHIRNDSCSILKFKYDYTDGYIFVQKDVFTDEYIIPYEITNNGYAIYNDGNNNTQTIYFAYNPMIIDSDIGSKQFRDELRFNYFVISCKRRTETQLKWAINKLIRDKGFEKIHFEIHYSENNIPFVLLGMTYEEYNFRNFPKKILPGCYFDYVLCSHCGEMKLSSSAIKVNNKYYCCHDCLNKEGYGVCDYCGTVHEISDLKQHPSNDKVFLCKKCYENNIFQCNLCGKYHSRCNLIATHRIDSRIDLKICFDCAGNKEILRKHGLFRCECCNRIYLGIPKEEEINGVNKYICSSCLSNIHKVVEGNVDSYVTKDMPRRIYAYHDYERVEWNSQTLRDINYPDNLYLGCELEIDTDYGSQDKVKGTVIAEAIENGNTQAEVYLSDDGSLSSRGFELISQPATPAFHLNLNGEGYDWEKGMKVANDLGYTSYDAGCCGLHFHVNRSYFKGSDYIIDRKIALFIAHNKEWLKDFSRRTNFGYCSFNDYGCNDILEVYDDNIGDANYKIDQVIDEYINACDEDTHGSAVNFSHRCDDGDEDNTVYTIEFRFLRGTLKYSTFAAGVQLISMICELVNASNDYEEVYEINKNSFISLAKRRNYKEFLKYMEDRNLM